MPHIYFSEKQKQIGINLGDTGQWLAKMDDGRIVEYSEIMLEPNGSNWDDAIYLGEGEVYQTGDKPGMHYFD